MVGETSSSKKLSPETLLIIPCCKTKNSGGHDLPKDYRDPLKELVSTSSFQIIAAKRKEFEHKLKDREHYMPAISRYSGNLYKSIPNFASEIIQRTNGEHQPKLIILSALYGPLHPLSLINDYELQMDKSRNHVWYKVFPLFLEDYVRTNRISSIRLYCGQSTGYNKVLIHAVESLREKRRFDDVTRYDVFEGNSYLTPHNHGLQLCYDLNIIPSKALFTKEVKPINV